MMPSENSVEADLSRRDFLYVATGAFALTGLGATLGPLIAQMAPDAMTLAVGAPLDVDLASLEPGHQMVVNWRGHPVFIVNRPSDALADLQSFAHPSLLADPDSIINQQPEYAQNWHRSIRPEYLVVVGVCTHLGCIPAYARPLQDVAANQRGGWTCPCHGSKYDLAGRVFKAMPAPYNLPVPPNRFVSEKILRVGENPSGSNFSFETIVQI